MRFNLIEYLHCVSNSLSIHLYIYSILVYTLHMYLYRYSTLFYACFQKNYRSYLLLCFTCHYVENLVVILLLLLFSSIYCGFFSLKPWIFNDYYWPMHSVHIMFSFVRALQVLMGIEWLLNIQIRRSMGSLSLPLSSVSLRLLSTLDQEKK